MKINLLERLLEASNLSGEEFNSLVGGMEKDPVGFITEEKDPVVAKKKNLAKSILQSLIRYEDGGYIVDKDEVDHMRLIILGTGAGGHAVSQRDRCGGIILASGDKRLHIDPGAGAVRDCEDFSLSSGENWDPVFTDAILLTHNHIDHAGGLEEYMECMTFSNLLSKEKIVLGNKTVIEGNPEFDQGPRLDRYMKSKLKVCRVMGPGDSIEIDGIEIRATKGVHIEAYDPETRSKGGYCIGYVIETPYGSIGITGDTEYYDSLPEEFKGIDYLITYMVQEHSRASREPERYTMEEIGDSNRESCHVQFLGEAGIEKLIDEIRPKTCFLTHYGDQLAMLINGKLLYRDIPEKIARRIQSNTGIETIACLNGMSIDVGKRVRYDVNENYFLNSNRLKPSLQNPKRARTPM